MATETFTASSGAWDVAGNWSGDRVPQSGDDVSIPGAGGSSTNMVTISATDPAYTVASLDIDPGSTQPLYVPELFDGGSLTVTGATTFAGGSEIEIDGGSLNLLGTVMLPPSPGAAQGESITVDSSGVLTIGTLAGNAGGDITVTAGTASIGADNSTVPFSIGASGRLTVGQFGQAGQSDGTGTSFDIDGGTLAIGDVGTSFMAVIALQTQLQLIGNPQRLVTEYYGGAIDATALPYQVGEQVRVTQTSQSIGPYGYALTDHYTILSPQGQTIFTLGDVFTSTDPAVPYITLSSDSAGGTLLTIACFTPQVMIQTPGGEVAAGALRIGDLVTTVDGGAEPVRWIGRRSYGGRFLARQAHLLPVRIRAGALGGGLPTRDLLVSPCHAMFLDGVLVPAGCLVNGGTIVQEVAAAQVDYVHIELDRHSLILAEGAATETFLDDESRGAFQNAAEYQALYGPGPEAEPVYCAPRVTDGYVLDAIRARLAVARAA